MVKSHLQECTKTKVQKTDLTFFTGYTIFWMAKFLANVSEFAKYSKQACLALGIKQYHSRPRTPKDNSDNERFNQTLGTDRVRSDQIR